MANFKRVVNVIPLTRVTLSGSQIFTYLVPLKLYGLIRPGLLVQIPFGRRSILGVTSSFEMTRMAQETAGLKELTELVDPSPVLSEKMLALANWLSQYYVTPLGMAIKAMLPRIVKRTKAPEIAGYERSDPDYVLNESQHRAAAAIGAALGKAETFLLYGPSGSGKTEIYLQLIKRVVASGKQVIVLVPEISLTTRLMELFARRFDMENLAVWGSHLRGSERLWYWQEVRAGRKLIVIGPRSGLFAPVTNLGLVVIDNEHDASFKQYDQHPKYDARTVAEKLCEIWSCPLVMGDSTPSVETYFNAQSGVYKLLALPHRIKADLEAPKIKIIDMAGSPGKSRIFSDFLKLEILGALRGKRQIILFANRRESTPYVEEEVRKFIRGELGKSSTIRIVRLEADIPEKDEIYADWIDGKISILVGTQVVAKMSRLARVGLVGIIAADDILQLPDFRSDERAYQLLAQFSAAGKETGVVVIQTNHPDHYVIQAMKAQDYWRFFASEIEERERFGYPPFVRLVKITCKGAAPEDVLKKLPQSESIQAFSVSDKGDGKVVLKLAPGNIDLFSLLKNLPPSADIDVDPENLL